MIGLAGSVLCDPSSPPPGKLRAGSRQQRERPSWQEAQALLRYLEGCPRLLCGSGGLGGGGCFNHRRKDSPV